MRVLVTGATGFIGSHTTAALVAAGHDVRVLVRNPERVARALGPHGVEPEIAVGDMTDERAVTGAIKGCDAVIHAAAQIGVGGGGTASDTNLDGVRTVIGAALEADVRRVVYTSSITVHVPTDEPCITLDTPLAEPLSPYAASKLAAERLVRGWQAEGHPISTVVLGGVYGPHAPELVNSFVPILAAIEMMMLVPPSGTTVIDVRDVAALLTCAVESERCVPRALAGGHFVTWSEWVSALENAVGHPISSQVMGRDELLDLAHKLTAAAADGGDPPLLNEEAALVMASGVPVDDSATRQLFGIEFRPLARTFADVVTYLRSIGRLPAAG